MAEKSSNIQLHPKQAYLGMNLNSIPSQIREGMLSYALNAVVENFDGNQVSYQNEQANVFCVNMPEGFRVIGQRNIIDEGIKLFWLLNPLTGESEIGKVVDCVYYKIINDPCLNFDIHHPILKTVYRKSDCGDIEIYWVDGLNRARMLNLNDIPYKIIKGENPCDDVVTDELDCNRLNIQPDYFIPQVDVTSVDSDGELQAGTYQFAVQYADANGQGYTSFYSVTNPTPIFDPTKITLDFNYTVNKSINVLITNLDSTGLYEYINLAVIKTINNISTVELVGIFDINGPTLSISYTGQSKTDIPLSPEDIFAKYDVYQTAADITTVQDTLVLADLTTEQRISYQEIANKIRLQWQTWRLPHDSYENPLVATYLRGLMGDEVYPYEISFLLDNGVQTDGFHIPGRAAIPSDLEVISNNDVIDTEDPLCGPNENQAPRWEVYNTATLLGYEQVYLDFLTGITPPSCPNPKVCGVIEINPGQPECYSGPFQYGDMAYWQSTDVYPCNDIYGELEGQPIRHHKLPDSTIVHIHDDEGFIYPKGIRISPDEIVQLIRDSSLTDEEKARIQGFKILRGNRANNKSVVAKGLVYNVGKYIKDSQTYFYPNYPFNDLRADPFITTESNYIQPIGGGDETNPLCFQYRVRRTGLLATFEYTDCISGEIVSEDLTPIVPTMVVCSITPPEFTFGEGTVTSFDLCYGDGGPDTIIEGRGPLQGFATDDSKERYTFHSPDTHFFQPTLGSVLKLETAEFGEAKSHFVEVRNHAKYKFISNEAVAAALVTAVGIGFASGTYGVSTNTFNGTAAYTALQVILDIIEKLLPNKNFVYQQTAVGNYTEFVPIANSGNKQRRIELGVYLQPGMAGVGDEHSVNNYQRESSVYIKTTEPLPFVSDIPGVPEDNTRWTLSEEGQCNEPTNILERDISSYYASIKRQIANQYGPLYSYETLDTGFQFAIDITKSYNNQYYSVFGGDVFINRFALKRKYPFFLDNRVSPEGTNLFANGSDIYYNELGNVGWPKYWFSTDVRRGSLFGFFGVKDTAFDCNGNNFFYDSGKIYLFSYGIPYFYCESEVNVDLRQAFNNKEGDFFPRIGSDIPDDWLQETYVSIKNDNTYYYNKTYSKQNKENFFSHLPNDWTGDECTTTYPYRIIFSEDWVLFKPSAKFDELPQTYGGLISIDGIENKQVLVRFEQTTMLYNALLTAPTSAGDVYLGQSLFSSTVPPLEYASTDLGYIGTQNKFLLKTEYGAVSVDAKRGHVFLLQGRNVRSLTSDTETQQVSKFFSEFLPFQIKNVSQDVDVDNAYNGLGITGVYDNKYHRLILTKLDYKPLVAGITYEDGKFYKDGVEIALTNPTYFCNYSFTISYDFDNQAWISFHSYIPNYYIGDTQKFYTGLNQDTSSLWTHNTDVSRFNNFYNTVHPYIIESAYSRTFFDEILQNIKDYSRTFKYTEWREFVETDDEYFNKLIIYSNQQCSGVLDLVPKPKNNLKEYGTYPRYNIDSKTIPFTKSGSFYQINTFWDMVVDTKKPIWNKSCENLSIFKELNQENMDYSKRSRKKSPFRSKELKIRYILDDKDDLKIISSFTVAPTAISYK